MITSTNQNPTGIYLIAIVPPQPLYAEIQEIKEYIGEKYKTKEALGRPPHITLIPPFNAPKSVEGEIKKFLNSFGSKQQSFDIQIDGYGEFSHGTLYMKPAESPEIMSMQKSLIKQFASVYARGKERGPSYGFHPHITVAYKDLTRPMFDAAWREFGDKLFRRRFTLKHIDLMKWDRGWQTISKGMFASATDAAELSLFP
jgi:2'-5' RNA ligase